MLNTNDWRLFFVADLPIGRQVSERCPDKLHENLLDAETLKYALSPQ